jgi:hypothetical protein
MVPVKGQKQDGLQQHTGRFWQAAHEKNIFLKKF